jgi:hypothetical protein
MSLSFYFPKRWCRKTKADVAMALKEADMEADESKDPDKAHIRKEGTDTLRFGNGFVEEVASTISAEKDELELIQPKPTISEEIFSNIQDSLGEISDYYKINKQQARSSFVVSVAAIGLGLATLMAGILLFYKYGSSGISVSSLSAIGGLLLNFIGGAYFYLQRKCQTTERLPR